MKLTGKVWKYGNDVNTDVIFPGRYTYALMNDEDMGTHALEDLDADFCQNGQPGDIIVGGKNWGCGSSREQAVKCLKARGIRAIIAKSFARIFYRNALNEGLATIVCAGASDAVQAGETITVDFTRNVITTPSGEYSFPAYPDFVRGLVEDGGLVPHVQKKLKLQTR
jgi:3-isopropylmalate dehydratase, small subunit